MTKDMYKEIEKSLKVLHDGGILVYPTDTIWGIGCDATDERSVQRVYAIKRRSESKSLIILVSDQMMLQDYVEHVPEKIRVFLLQAERPTTVIYRGRDGLASNVLAADGTVAIRVVQDDFCRELIRRFGKPIVSTSANFSNSPSPGSFTEIEESLLKKADYIVNLSRDKKQVIASQIIKLNDAGEVEFLRK